MPTVLQNIGASGAGTSLADYVSRERNLKNQMAVRKEVGAARSEALKSSADLDRNKLIELKKQREEESRVEPFETVLNRTKIPKVRELTNRLAHELGLVNPDGNITVKNKRQLQQYLSMDMHMTNISNFRVEHRRDEYRKLVKAQTDPELAKKMNLKPGTPEFKEQLDGAEFLFKQAAGTNEAYQTHVENSQKIKELRQKLAIANKQIASREGIAAAQIEGRKDVAGIRADATTTDKINKAQVWILPNRDIVRSFDGGKTYIGKDGTMKVMPTEGAVKSNAQYTGTEIATLKEQKKALAEAKPVEQGSSTDVKTSAEAGTGVWANAAAAIDSVLGGLGVDALVGKDGFFKDTQDARQKLRLIKQLGKSAFMNSSRGAIWEQKKIDKLFPDPNKLFANPRTEARKFGTLREALLTEKQFNENAMRESVNPKEISKLKASNIAIDRLLSHIGMGSGTGELTTEDQALIQKYLKK